MDFLKGLRPIAHWLLRLSLILSVYFQFRHDVASLALGQIDFYIGVLSFIGAILLLLGGFSSSSSQTRLGGLILVLLSLYLMLSAFQGPDYTFSLKLGRFSIAFYFMAAGNK